MQKRIRTIKEIEKKYDLELGRVVLNIKKINKKNKTKLILLQFPDGLKPYATAIVDYLEKHTGSEFIIWFDTCFGACDIPVGLDSICPKIDLIIQFGHNKMMPRY